MLRGFGELISVFGGLKSSSSSKERLSISRVFIQLEIFESRPWRNLRDHRLCYLLLEVHQNQSGYPPNFPSSRLKSPSLREFITFSKTVMDFQLRYYLNQQRFCSSDSGEERSSSPNSKFTKVAILREGEPLVFLFGERKIIPFAFSQSSPEMRSLLSISGFS
jgi:hypothetical protein